MKILIGSLIGLIGSAIVVFFDIKLVSYIFSLVPISEWAGLVKVGIVFVDIWLTVGICILPFVFGFGIGAILEKT